MEDRQIRGYAIISKGDMPQMVSEETFKVPSQSGSFTYTVKLRKSLSCECKDFVYRKNKCKHIYAVEFLLKMRAKHGAITFDDKVVEQPKCAYCDSLNVKKNGKRKIDGGYKQRFSCLDCKKTFVEDSEFAKLKANPKIVTLTMDLYYKGLSLRDITDTLNQFFSIKLHHETVRKWIMKFTEAMGRYTKQFTPKVSDAWHIDEQNIKVKGKWIWSWNVLDENTRFLIANNITEDRYTKDARTILQMAKANTKVKPTFIVTDGLRSYQDAIRKEFNTTNSQRPKAMYPETSHVRLRTIRDKPNNNLVERYHSTFRERDKVMRGFKTQHTAQILSNGFRDYYNFIRPHTALDGLTPNQVADIDLNLERNRWLSLLKKSLENNRV